MVTAAAKRLKVEIHGAVQGVGFRPFVYFGSAHCLAAKEKE